MIRAFFALSISFAFFFCASFSSGCFLLPATDEPADDAPTGMALPSAVQWDNTPGGYHHARAYTDYLKKKYEDAIKTCDEGERKIREFAKTQNRDPASYVNLGMLMLLRGTCYYDNGNFDKALVEFNNVVKIRPYDRAGHYNVALALTRKGLYAEAIKEACRAVELDPTHAESEALYKWLKNKIIEEKRKPGKPAEDEP